jgi:endothelin-converting enzyme/putative endopeptidase
MVNIPSEEVSMHLRRVQVAALLCLLAGGSAISVRAQTSSGELPPLEHFNAGLVDTHLDACDDFYQYANGKWLAAHPIPPDQADWSVANPLALWNETLLRETLEKASAPKPSRTSNEQKIGDFYYACMDEKDIDAHTAEWIKPELERINALRNKSDIALEVARLHQTIPGAWEQGDDETDAPLLGFSGLPDYDDASRSVAQFDQGGMALPGRSFYLDETAKAREIRAQYLAHIANILALSGENRVAARADAAVVLEIETALARAAMEPVARRDPKNMNNKMSRAQVKALAPSFDWDRYLEAVHAPATPHFIVTSPNFFKSLETLLERQPLEHWKAYLRWQFLHGSAGALSTAFENESFAFYGHTLFGVEKLEPRWRRCVRSVDGNLGEAFGQVYVARAFPPESKQRALRMVDDIEAALAQDIAAQDWMAPATRRQALAKLHATLNKIGYPDKWRDYSSLQVGRSSHLANRQNAARFEFERWVNKIGKPVDRTEWGMTPPTINAYEDPQTNTLNFPAGILQPPYFDSTQDDAVNYGATGATIGHEAIHGFDDQGRKFDAVGSLRNWWTAEDAEDYEERGKCIAEEYTQLVPEAGPDVKQDGRMTQGEDTADNGGLHLAFMALQAALARQGKNLDTKEQDGLTPRQRFFLSYAFSWCGKYRPESLRTLVLSDPHSYPKYRVNNVVSNMPEFWQAFGCHPGQKMVRAKACRIW